MEGRFSAARVLPSGGNTSISPVTRLVPDQPLVGAGRRRYARACLHAVSVRYCRARNRFQRRRRAVKLACMRARRVWSEWASIIGGVWRSGGSHEAFCATRRLNVGTFRAWLYRLRKASPLPDVALVPVELARSTAPLTRSAGAASDGRDRRGGRRGSPLRRGRGRAVCGRSDRGAAFAMLTLPSSVRIYLAAEPVDLRRGHDGLVPSCAAAGN